MQLQRQQKAILLGGGKMEFGINAVFQRIHTISQRINTIYQMNFNPPQSKGGELNLHTYPISSDLTSINNRSSSNNPTVNLSQFQSLLQNQLLSDEPSGLLPNQDNTISLNETSSLINNLYNRAMANQPQENKIQEDQDTNQSYLYQYITDKVPEELLSLVKRASEEYNVDVNLLASIIMQESRFDTTAVSPAGAMGLMQLMPNTANALGVTDPFDAEQNLFGGTQYISNLLQQFDQDERLALAAYNAGPTRVRQLGRIPDYPETQNFVNHVLQYKNDLTLTGLFN